MAHKPMGVLTPGEIEAGMFITVYERLPLEFDVVNPQTYEKRKVDMVPKDDSYHGAVLEVTAVQLPYLVVTDLMEDDILTMDTRAFRFMELRDEFVAATLGGEFVPTSVAKLFQQKIPPEGISLGGDKVFKDPFTNVIDKPFEYILSELERQSVKWREMLEEAKKQKEQKEDEEDD